MTVAEQPAPLADAAWREAVDAACDRIMPTWPLDRSIAVNPWWGWRSETFEDTAATLQALGRVRCLMPKAWFRDRWRDTIRPGHLQAASRETGVHAGEAELVRYLHESPAHGHHWHNITDLLDARPGHEHRMAWRDEVLQQVSQFCGLYFQYPERMQQHRGDGPDLYAAWLNVVRHDRGIEVLMGETGLGAQFRQLPEDPGGVFDTMFQLAGGSPHFSEYAGALLLDIHGWASWLAYGAWQNSFHNRPDDGVRQLLAIRMAWELVLWRHTRARDPQAHAEIKSAFRLQFEQYSSCRNHFLRDQRYLLVWQRALEIAYASGLHATLARESTSSPSAPQLQAVFCIDVRSEPMRRALEAQDPSIQTLGFAGFFGLPLEYAAPAGAYTRPQLPGLVTPGMRATQVSGSTARRQDHRVVTGLASHAAGRAAPAAFGLVEAWGLAAAWSLLKKSWFPGKPEHPVNRHIDSSRWELTRDAEPISLEEKADLAAGVLRAMGLVRGFAPVVLLLGHGSATVNNPQAAALDCGACGGQTGEVNARVLAQLLNEPEIRRAVQDRGIVIPQATRFIAGLHNTTTDEITCYDAPESAPWRSWLDAASRRARHQRAAGLGLDPLEEQRLPREYANRSRDWSRLRPEWGLANNAAFIVAPRSRTRGLNLEGRCFLHDYTWQDDPSFGILESIMTAPMLVTNWINLQYFASVTDNGKYGSGNKMLHNVVGGHIGVFEGNGGDLRIGLAMQSLHDGRQWRHQPLRLSVYIAAPREAITDIIRRQPVVAELIDNHWLYLYRLDDDTNAVHRYHRGEWTPADYKPSL